jgi:hypothetical protein
MDKVDPGALQDHVRSRQEHLGITASNFFSLF